VGRDGLRAVETRGLGMGFLENVREAGGGGVSGYCVGDAGLMQGGLGRVRR